MARVRAERLPSSTVEWSLAILSGLARSARDDVAIWAGGGKGLDEGVDDALAPFFHELLSEHPDARILTTEETDSDEGDDRRVSRWTERACAGLEEGETDLIVERTSKVACRFAQPERDDDDDDDDDGERGEGPSDVEGVATSPTWELCAPRVSVVGYGGHFDRDEATRVDLSARLRDAALHTSDENVRLCLSTLVEAVDGWKDGAYPSWCHDGTVVDIAALVEALLPITFAMVIYQPDGETAKVARIEEGAVTHHDVRVGLAWSPALTPTLPAKIELGTTHATNAPPQAPLPKSPHREALFAALSGASRVGLRDQPAFQALLGLSPAERRTLLLDVGAESPAAVAGVVEGIVYLMLELTVIAETDTELLEIFASERSLSSGRALEAFIGLLERFIAKQELSVAVATAMMASPALRRTAARAPRKPDRSEKKKPEYRALRLLRAAEEITGPSDPWRAAVERDLATASSSERAAWRALIAAWEEHPLPYAVGSASKKFEEHLGALGGDHGAARARHWLGLFIDHARGPGPSLASSRDEHEAKLRFVEGLVLLVMREPALGRHLGRALLDYAIAPNAAGGIASPRLVYRAIDLLASTDDVDALRAVAASRDYPRVSAYAALRAGST